MAMAWKLWILNLQVQGITPEVQGRVRTIPEWISSINSIDHSFVRSLTFSSFLWQIKQLGTFTLARGIFWLLTTTSKISGHLLKISRKMLTTGLVPYKCLFMLSRKNKNKLTNKWNKKIDQMLVDNGTTENWNSSPSHGTVRSECVW